MDGFVTRQMVDQILPAVDICIPRILDGPGFIAPVIGAQGARGLLIQDRLTIRRCLEFSWVKAA